MSAIFVGIVSLAVAYIVYHVWVLKADLDATLAANTARILGDLNELRAKVLWLEAELETMKPSHPARP